MGYNKRCCLNAVLRGIDKIRQESIEKLDSHYKSFKLLNIDIMYDENIKPWLLEVNFSKKILLLNFPFQVNTNLSLLAVDDFVNNEMVAEMFNILGFNIPNMSPHFSESPKEPNKYFDPNLYCCQLSEEELLKHEKFSNKQLTVANIVNNLTPADVRAVIRHEDASTQLKKWSRLMPSEDPAMYSLLPSPTYFDCLLHSWRLKNSETCMRNREMEKMFDFCDLRWHLKVPEKR